MQACHTIVSMRMVLPRSARTAEAFCSLMGVCAVVAFSMLRIGCKGRRLPRGFAGRPTFSPHLVLRARCSTSDPKDCGRAASWGSSGSAARRTPDERRPLELRPGGKTGRSWAFPYAARCFRAPSCRAPACPVAPGLGLRSNRLIDGDFRSGLAARRAGSAREYDSC